MKLVSVAEEYASALDTFGEALDVWRQCSRRSLAQANAERADAAPERKP